MYDQRGSCVLAIFQAHVTMLIITVNYLRMFYVKWLHMP